MRRIGSLKNGLVLGALVAASCATAQALAGSGDVTISGSRVHPESITSDRAGNLYNGSTNGTIYRTPAGTRTAEPWIKPDAENGLTFLFGVFVDEGRGVLWACNNPNIFARQTGTSSLKAFDLKTGKLTASHDFPTDAPAACNDIATATDGTVWVSETSGGRIFVVRPGASTMELYAKAPELVGIDGIAVAGDGKIYINNVRQQFFQRVERKTDGSYDRLTNLTVSSPLAGPDGLRSLGGNRFIQGEGQGGRVALVDVNGDNATITPVATGLNGPVGVTVVGGTAYIVEGKINYLVDPAMRDQNPDPFVIRAFPVPRN